MTTDSIPLGIALIHGNQVNAWMYDCELPQVQYGSAAAGGNQRVSKISWTGKTLDYLGDGYFPPFLQGEGDWVQ